MASTAVTISMSFTALVISGLAMWRADSHASTREPARVRVAAAAPAPVVAPAVAPAAPVVRATVEAPALRSPVSGLAVRRLVVGTGVENREAVGHASEYELTQGQRFCAVIEMANQGDARQVRVRFEPDGDARRSVGFVRLAVPSTQRYRTWGCTERVQAPGTWSAVVETVDGRELARDVFTVR
jgi:hypothetical protein